jgi:hypothetical protein
MTGQAHATARLAVVDRWIFGLFGAADAQTPSLSTANTQFDGTYAFVSAAKVNDTYTVTGTNRIGQCRDMGKAGPLVIINGHAQYTAQGGATGTGYLLEGAVGPQRELAMRNLPAPRGRCGGCGTGIQITVSGRIDDGTVRARQTGSNCRYDLIWQKYPD